MTDMSLYKIGNVVRLLGPSENRYAGKELIGGYVGHVVGFSSVETQACFEVILKIKWFHGVEVFVHPNNVELI
jgi:hypothetical protein